MPPKRGGDNITVMKPRLFIAATLLLLASPLTSAGVIVHEQDSSSIDLMAVSLDGNLPSDTPIYVQNKSGEDMSFAVTTASGGVSLVALTGVGELVSWDSSLTERIRLWRSCLPRSPFLEHLLKPS